MTETLAGVTVVAGCFCCSKFFRYSRPYLRQSLDLLMTKSINSISDGDTSQIGSFFLSSNRTECHRINRRSSGQRFEKRTNPRHLMCSSGVVIASQLVDLSICFVIRPQFLPPNVRPSEKRHQPGGNGGCISAGAHEGL